MLCHNYENDSILESQNWAVPVNCDGIDVEQNTDICIENIYIFTIFTASSLFFSCVKENVEHFKVYGYNLGRLCFVFVWVHIFPSCS